ncbi:MAG TPA: hypothetical protein VG269_14910 [Tepidisphaeraceae bacterium]|jgi:hypothetical protein|nr:hypothetical protein [Tepidisphaeraceae bacterium]
MPRNRERRTYDEEDRRTKKDLALGGEGNAKLLDAPEQVKSF